MNSDLYEIGAVVLILLVGVIIQIIRDKQRKKNAL